MSKRLSPAEYATLQSAYSEAMSGDGSPGCHQVLIGVLNRLGYNVRSFEQAYKLAEKLLYG